MILASGAKPFTATPGQLLAKEGEEANKFFLIQSGRVSIGIKKPAVHFGKIRHDTVARSLLGGIALNPRRCGQALFPRRSSVAVM